MQPIKTIFLILLAVLTKTALSQNETIHKEVIVRGIVTNFNKRIRPLETLVFSTPDTLIRVLSDSTGRFTTTLLQGYTWHIEYTSLTDFNSYDSLFIPLTEEQIEIDLELSYETPKTYTLRNVHFDIGKSTLKPESFEELNKLVLVMRQRESMIIEIAGHTDSTGSAELNLRLSGERANTVRSYLTGKGIEESRIIANGYGQEQPIESNSTPEGRAVNRRTEVRILAE